ncbi:hypothetical protein, variant [Saprolegnia diclina VS20]|uniref:Uncharacterized protein n=1 Tax=Saprolegnia diclina (strain VS20) TaxID=1156394 RepID=T0RQ49_SAPDV|nr:hypothetical protein, variant [Saprolegnia diclina VS20]EQC34648.1 hypothetical protein, variant [Saprolegnia diclina VS20]|eukprot:XP_008612054.1 hypothetical protein, variant [Saprolegnia diclina VS20]
MAARVLRLVLLLHVAVAASSKVGDVEVEDFSFGRGTVRSTTTNIEITTIEITGSELKDHRFSHKVRTPDPPPASATPPAAVEPDAAALSAHDKIERSLEAMSKDANDHIDRVEILTPEQMHRVSMAVLSALLLGGALVAIAMWFQQQRQTQFALAWLAHETSRDAIAAAMTGASVEFQDAAALRLRLLDFQHQVDKLVAAAMATTFDDGLCTFSSTSGSLGELLASMQAGLCEVKAFTAEVESPADRALCAAWHTALTSHLETLGRLQARIQRTLHSLLASDNHRMQWSMDELERLWQLWNSLGLDDEDTTWYTTARKELEARASCVSNLESLLAAFATSPALSDDLREMQELVATAQRHKWVHEVIARSERFVQDTSDENDAQLVTTTHSYQVSRVERELAAFRDHRDERIQEYVVRDHMAHDVAVRHLERMMFDYALHLHNLEHDHRLETQRLVEQRRLHQEVLAQRQRQATEAAQHQCERDRIKYAAKLEAAEKKKADREAERQRKREEKRQDERAKEKAQLLRDRSVAEWRHVERWARWNGCLLLLLLAMIFWEVVSTSGVYFSPACDNDASYWSPFSTTSRWSCQLVYGLKVAGGLIGILAALTGFAYLNLPSLGLGLLCSLALYVFRQVWREMLVHWRYMLGLALGHYVVGLALGRDRRLAWRIGGYNVRPLLVYLIYPLVSCALTIAVGVASCPLPDVCLDRSLFLVQLLL